MDEGCIQEEDEKLPVVIFKRIKAPWENMTAEQIRIALEMAYG